MSITEKLDSAILAGVSEHWTKVAMVLARAADAVGSSADRKHRVSFDEAAT